MHYNRMKCMVRDRMGITELWYHNALKYCFLYCLFISEVLGVKIYFFAWYSPSWLSPQIRLLYGIKRRVAIHLTFDSHCKAIAALFLILYVLCLTSRTTVTSARIPEVDACHRARNLCVFSRVHKGTPGCTHKGCVLQRVFLGALSDVTVVLGMRQSIVMRTLPSSLSYKDTCVASNVRVQLL